MPKAYLIGDKPKLEGRGTHVSARPRMVEVVSSSKICERCMIFCMERKPIFKHGESARYVKVNGTFPTTTVFCKNGCHLRFADWGWLDIADRKLEKQHIPWR